LLNIKKVSLTFFWNKASLFSDTRLDEIKAGTVVYYSLLTVSRSLNARLSEGNINVNVSYQNVNTINVQGLAVFFPESFLIV
jgi:hypothetical protein